MNDNQSSVSANPGGCLPFLAFALVVALAAWAFGFTDDPREAMAWGFGVACGLPVAFFALAALFMAIAAGVAAATR